MERPDVPGQAADVLLRDGGIAVIRPLTSEDLDEVRALHVRASDDAIRLRFFSSSRRPALQYVDHLARDDGTLALVALVDRRIVALASAEPLEAGSAEVAFLIDEDQRGRGLGSLLLEHLAAAARRRDVRRFVAEVLPENHAMMGVLMDAGFAVTRHLESGVVDIAMDTAVSPRALAAADERDSLAEASSLARLERLIVAAGRFADDVPQAAELDLNPVLVSPGGCAVVDLKLRLAPTSVDIDRATLRMLGGGSVSR